MSRRGFVIPFLLGAVFGVVSLLLLGVEFVFPNGAVVSEKKFEKNFQKVEKLVKTDNKTEDNKTERR